MASCLLLVLEVRLETGMFVSKVEPIEKNEKRGRERAASAAAYSGKIVS